MAMAFELRCDCGHLLRFEAPPTNLPVRCPRCQRSVGLAAGQEGSPAGGAALKPLWQLIGPPPTSAAALPPHTPPAPPPQGSDASSASVKGLWQLMNRSAPAPVDSPPAAQEKSTSSADWAAGAAPAEAVLPPGGLAPVPRKGLWSLMDVGAGEAGVETRSSLTSGPASVVEPARELQPVAEPLAADIDSGTTAPTTSDAAPTPENFNFEPAPAARPASAAARNAARLGALSLPLALLGLFDRFGSSIPAAAIGFLAILFGFRALNSVSGARGMAGGTGLPWFGIASGIVGALAGPFLAQLGRHASIESKRRVTLTNLTQIGVGLNRFHDARGAFPPGGVFKPGPDKKDRPLHGWLTLLLPYLGEERLFRQINLDQPYDDPANLPAMAQDVAVFFASGADRAKIDGRFGAAHFAGVGGEVIDEDGGYSQAGLFGVNSEVTRDAVTDGLSQTLAAGEIAVDFPAWGEPENWRLVGRGLNRNPAGFGNADRTGACFLMADGSVKFFSNAVDPKVLAALSTRDGGETIPAPHMPSKNAAPEKSSAVRAAPPESVPRSKSP